MQRDGQSARNRCAVIYTADIWTISNVCSTSGFPLYRYMLRKEKNNLIFVSQGQSNFTHRQKMKLFNGHIWMGLCRTADGVQQVKFIISAKVQTQ